MCIELCFDKHITLSTQIWIEWPVSYKLMPETLRFPQSKGSGYCCTRSRDLLHLCDLFLNLCNSNIIDLLEVSRYYTAYATNTSSRSIIYSYFSSAWIHSMNTLHGFTYPDTRCIERKIERRISCLLQKVIKQWDFPCLSDQRVACV